MRGPHPTPANSYFTLWLKNGGLGLVDDYALPPVNNPNLKLEILATSEVKGLYDAFREVYDVSHVFPPNSSVLGDLLYESNSHSTLIEFLWNQVNKHYRTEKFKSFDTIQNLERTMLEVEELDSYMAHYPHVLDVEEGLGPRTHAPARGVPYWAYGVGPWARSPC